MPGSACPGAGGKGADGGAVDVTNVGALGTSGNGADGIMAQSVGGGGGNGGFSGSLSAGGYGAVSLAFGGAAGNGGGANNVSVANTGNVDTAGVGSTGIFAQSIGGGGGNGGFAAGGAGALYAGAALTFGGGAVDGGGAMDARVTSMGNLTTQQDQANGIEAQSIGGGGGNGGFAISASGLKMQHCRWRSAAPAGRAARRSSLPSISTGNITTHGVQADGIIAQSVGGGGGNDGFAVSGTLTIDLAARRVSPLAAPAAPALPPATRMSAAPATSPRPA